MKTSYLANIQKINENLYLLGYGTLQEEISAEKAKQIYMVLQFTQTNRTRNEMEKFMERNNIEKGMIEYLLAKKQITNNRFVFNKADVPEFKNFLLLESLFNNSERIIRNLQKTNFYVIGCGGIGNNIAYALASNYPKSLVLIDGDTVCNGNLNRQFLFDRSLLGKYKAECLKAKLVERFENVEINHYNEFASTELLDKILQTTENNMLLVSGDEYKVLETTMSIAVKTKTPLLNIGYLNDISIIGPFYIPGVSACPFCSNIGASACENDLRCKEYSPPSSYINNTLAADLAMIDILYYFSDDYSKINSLNKRIGICCKDFSKRQLVVEKNENCCVCAL